MLICYATGKGFIRDLNIPGFAYTLFIHEAHSFETVQQMQECLRTNKQATRCTSFDLNSAIQATC
jgi:hypothetical protein